MDSDKDQKDELFEDLDKFFAPIQDVEWPEPEAPAGEAEEPEAHRGAVRVEPEEEPPAVLDPPESEDEEDAPPAGEDVRHDTQVYEGVVVRGARASTGESDPTEDQGVEEDRPGDTAGSAREAVRGQPGGPPSVDEVEAAAEHFASSVRAEAEAGPEIEAIDEEASLTPEGEDEGEEEPEAYRAPTAPDTPTTAAEVEQSLLADLDQSEPTTPAVVGSEGMAGPSWQEPTSVEVGGDLEGRPGRDVPAAFLTGAVLAAVAIGSLLIDEAVFAVVASILVLLAQGEIYGVMHNRHLQPATAVGLVTGALVLGAAYFHGEAAMLAMLALGTAFTFLWFMVVPATLRKDLTVGMAVTMFPVLYVPALAGYALTTLSLPAALDGQALMIAVIGLTFAYDTAAFFVGSVWGSRPLAQTISPKKSWEGAVGATLVVLIISIAFVASLVDAFDDSVAKALGLAVVVVVFAPLGDLAESLVKRDLDVKDMGSLLPGHGGVMDRIDSLLFVAPAALIFFRIFL